MGQRTSTKLLLASAAALLSLPGCRAGDTAGGTPARAVEAGAELTGLASDDLVLMWTEMGGCGMVRPDCPRYEIQADGDVSTYRTGEPDVVTTGTVDPVLVEAWIEVSRGTNVSALLTRLGPGEEAAPFEGVDYRLDAPLVGLTVSSAEKYFDPDEPFFAAALELVRAAAQAAPLPEQR